MIQDHESEINNDLKKNLHLFTTFNCENIF